MSYFATAPIIFKRIKNSARKGDAISMLDAPFLPPSTPLGGFGGGHRPQDE
jgi:hypothetical protein